jgi:hypothetical protein
MQTAVTFSPAMLQLCQQINPGPYPRAQPMEGKESPNLAAAEHALPREAVALS